MSKNNKLKYTAALVLTFAISVYLFVPIIAASPGHIENIIHMYGTESFTGNLKLLMANKILLLKWFKCSIFFFAFVAFLIFIASHINSKKESGPSTIPEQGTHGTARWLTREEAKKIFTVKSGPVDGLIFGKLEKSKDIQLKRSGNFETVAISSSVKSNKNVAVYGAAGSGKSRAFVRNEVLQIAKMKQSMVVTDPKGELFESMAGFLQDEGYDVKVLNLVNMIHSDRWNPLAEVTDDISAQSFVETVMANTRPPGAKVDEFWEKSEMNLLKALVLYVVNICPEEERNLANVYSMLALKDVVTLDAMFAPLNCNHPAKMPYAIYSQASDKIKPNIVIGLGSKLQIFQNEIVQNLTSTSDIDLTAPKYKKTAYFCITSDSESTFDFLASLFFSFLFIKLTKYADFYPDDYQKEVYFILDEFPNIGAIPDFTKKISTLRSRGIICFVIFQNIAQLQNRYPNNGWSEILGNCNSQLFLGATDDLTAKQVSDHIGITTVETHSNNKKAGIEGMADMGSQNTSSAKRNLLNPDEITKLDKKKAILMLNGQQPLLLYKFDYSEHELSSKLRNIEVRNYKLPWAEKYYPAEEEMIEKAKKEAESKEKETAQENIIGFERLKYRLFEILNRYLTKFKIKAYNRLISDSYVKSYVKESTEDKKENEEKVENEKTETNEESLTSKDAVACDSLPHDPEIKENKEESKESVNSDKNSFDILNEFFDNDDSKVVETKQEDIEKDIVQSDKVKKAKSEKNNSIRSKELEDKIRNSEKITDEQLNFFGDSDMHKNKKKKDGQSFW